MSMESAIPALADRPELSPAADPVPTLTAHASTTLAPAIVAAVNDSDERTTPLPLRERDKNERFAHDINAKIDALEAQIGHTTSLLERSQEFVKTALEELRDRIMGVRHDAETKLATHRQHLDSHQKTLETQHHALSTLGTEVANQSGDLERQQLHLTTHEVQIETLDQRHAELQQMLVGLSQEHDSTLTKVNLLADQLHDAGLQIQAHEQKHLQARKLIIALASVSAISISAFAWFLFNPIAASTATESQLAALTSDMADQRTSTANISGELHRMGTGLTILEGNVNALQDSQTSLQSDQQGQGAAIGTLIAQVSAFDTHIADLRVRLQRALGARAPLAVPVLTLHDRTWLTGRPADHYVIQLVGAREYDTVVRLVNRHADLLRQQPLAMNVVTHEGQPWHNLMYGDFATLQEARTALSALPPELQAAQPWVRQVKTVVRGAR